MTSHSEVKDAEIPVIDISDTSSDTAHAVLHAASTFGFLFIKNDGVTIPPKDIDDMFALSRKFFHGSKEEKAAYSIHSERAGGKNRGWVAMQGEALDPENEKQGDPKEAFNIAPPQPTLQPLPPALSTSSALISRFQTSCHRLCTRILYLLGTALSLSDPAYFSSRHDQTAGPSGTIFRLLYYPPSESRSKTSIRAGAHSDYGSVTLLFRLPGQAGLEILKPDRTWAPVPVNPSPSTLPTPPILVNIGDLLSFWTNGMLKSTMHRVTFQGGQERYSMAYFCHPLDEARLDVVESEAIMKVKDDEAARSEVEAQRNKIGWVVEEGTGEVLTAGEHLNRRLNVTYGLKD